MKQCCLFIFLISYFFSQAQDYDQLNKVDSLCKLIDEDTSDTEFDFEVKDSVPGIFPLTLNYHVKTKAGFITYIRCTYNRVGTAAPVEYGERIEKEMYFYWGTLLKFNHTENFMELDTTIKNIEERIEKGIEILPWSLHVWLFKFELLHYYSNGHGMTERDDFDVKDHCTSEVVRLKGEVKKMKPGLK